MTRTRRASPAWAAALLSLTLPACGQVGPAGEGPLLPTEARAEGPAAPRRAGTPCRVLRLIDGDTLVCEGTGSVRLIGIDAPERAQGPFGALATEALGRLVPTGAEVLLEPDVEPRDRYGRTLAWVWRDSVLVNWAMVRAGYALLATFPPNVQWVDELAGAERRAREEAAGLWADDGFACPPADHRRGRCR